MCKGLLLELQVLIVQKIFLFSFGGVDTVMGLESLASSVQVKAYFDTLRFKLKIKGEKLLKVEPKLIKTSVSLKLS